MAKRSREEMPPVLWECSGNEKQELFLTCPADEILYGGAAGGGKSDALLMFAIGGPDNGIFNNPHWNVLMLRRTFPELEKSLIVRSQGLFTGKGKYDGVKHRWTFPGGGRLDFGHIKNDADVVKYQSAEYCRIIWDELTHFTERMYLYMFSRLRTTDPTIRCRVGAATNPGGIGHGWVKKRFIEDRKPLEIYSTQVKLPDGNVTDWSLCYIPATVFDNKYLVKNDPMYVRRLMELPEVEKKALLYGSWDIYAGQFFADFSEDHICDAFVIPDTWPIWMSMDFGVATRCAIGFYTQDPESGMYYMFEEIYCTKKDVYAVSALIKEKLGRHFTQLVGRFADRRIMIKDDETQVSTKEKFSHNGLYFVLATDDRVPGWHAARELLMKDKEGRVRFKVFKHCEQFIRTMPEQIHDVNKPEDLDRKGETHHPDQFRYFAIMRKSTELHDDRNYQPLQVNSATGYIGMNAGEEETPLRFKIARLTNAPRGINLCLDRKEPS